ncbi:MAG: hypothetical protein ACYC3X_12530 [Pirellulaceae bacterium]
MTPRQPHIVCPCRVVKVGGSLLELPDLWHILTNWLDRQPLADTLLVVGGGELVEFIRRLDQRFGLGDETAHWLSIQAMSLHGFVLSRLVPDAVWMEGLSDWHSDHKPVEPQRRFISAECFLRREEPQLPGVRLPVGWHVTSDSIAARLAEVCQAWELVLLKSTLPLTEGRPISSQEAVATGLVDRHFPTSAAPLRHVRVVNLRDADFAEASLKG